MQFSKDECSICNQAGEWILNGTRMLDKCYEVSSTSSLSCHWVLLDKFELWYQCLDHINFRNLSKISKRESIVGLPMSLKAKKMVCGSFQEKKRRRVLNTRKVLIFSHLDYLSCFTWIWCIIHKAKAWVERITLWLL